MGERNLKGQTNFMIVDKDTTDIEIELQLKQFIEERSDIGVILLSQQVADRVRKTIVAHTRTLPTLLEIPSKDHPYDPSKDTVVVKAANILWGPDTAGQKLAEMQIASQKPL